MKLSIIIPTLNEEDTIGSAIESGRPDGAVEVIVADGGSADRTAAIARQAGARIIECGPGQCGRGRQLNTGAAAASGDVLLFLHADTRLPHGFAAHVAALTSLPGVAAGAFELRIDSPWRSFRMIERVVRWRSRRLQLPYGDQAIFLRREMFDRVGGFPNVDAMEDFVLVRRLRRIGRIAIAPAAVTTSPRRWLEHGIWRTTLLNQVAVAAYCMGVDPGRIARWRGPRKSSGLRAGYCRPAHDPPASACGQES